MKDFVAIDVETATRARFSICQIGITEVIGGELQPSRSWYVQPPRNEYEPANIAVHGIRPEYTYESPSFPEVWAEVRPLLEGRIVVAHNAPFDMYALRDALTLYHLPFPNFTYYCSLRISKCLIKGCYSYSLNVLLSHLGIEMHNHHDAGADTTGCAQLMMRCMEMADMDFDDIRDRLHILSGHFASPCSFAGLSSERVSQSVRDEAAILSFSYQPDPDNYFYGKQVCFTGNCRYAKRRDMLSMVATVGGIPSETITKATQVLVVGQVDYRYMDDAGMSRKQRRALDMLAAGQEIEILSEAEFLERFG